MTYTKGRSQPGTRKVRRRRSIATSATASLAVVSLVVVGLLAAAPAGAQTSAATRLLPVGNAWGTSVVSDDTVRSGPSARSGLGCSGTHADNNVAAVEASGVSTGVVQTRVDAVTINGGPGSRAVSVVHDVDLLDGRITADAVKAVSRTWHDDSGFHGNGRGSSFLNLRIDGSTYSADASGRIQLDGIGYVLLDRRTSRTGGAMHKTHMIEVHVTQDAPSLGLTAGTVIVVAHAQTAIKQVGGILGGIAFGSQGVASAAPIAAEAGRSAVVHVSCGGTDGQLRTNQILRRR